MKQHRSLIPGRSSTMEFDSTQRLTETPYIVREGDSITKIAFRFKMNVNVLRRINHLDDFLYPGQIIKVLLPSVTDTHFIDKYQYRRMHSRSQHLSMQKKLIGEFEFQEIKADQKSVAQPYSSLQNLSDNHPTAIQKHSEARKLQISSMEAIIRMHEELCRLQEESKEVTRIEPTIQKTPSELDLIKTEAYYCTELGEVKGLITVTNYLLIFDGVHCVENEINELCKKPSEFHVTIDLRDVTELKKVKLAGSLSQNFNLLALFLSYSHDYYLNITVSTVNGSIAHSSKGQAVASVFFKLSHRDHKGVLMMSSQLDTKQDKIYQKMDSFLKGKQESQKSQKIITSTIIPYYQATILDQEPTIEINPNPDEYFRNINFLNGVSNFSDFAKRLRSNIELKIPLVQLNVLNESKILQGEEIYQIALHLPPLVQMKNWKLLYSKQQDGTSFTTFFKKVATEDSTLIVLQDGQRKKLGAFCSGQWAPKQGFFGRSETFLFQFTKEKTPVVYKCSGENEFFLYADKKSIGVGGSKKSLSNGKLEEGGFGLYLSDNFGVGKSGKCDTFGNPPLSSDVIFEVKRVEVFGFFMDI